MEVQINQADMNHVKSMVADIKNGYKKVLVTSINKTLTTAKVQATARIGNELNLKAARIKQDFTIQKANYSKISGALLATGEPVGLVNFAARQVQKGVSVKVLKSSSRMILKHAYIASGKKSTGQHVFWRAGRAKMPAPKKFKTGKKSMAAWPRFGDKYRAPAERLTGPRIEDIFAQPKVLDPVSIQANHIYALNVEKKIEEVLRRHNG